MFHWDWHCEIVKLSNKTFIFLIINYDKEIVMGQGGLTTLTTAPFWTQVEREIAEYDPIMKKKGISLRKWWFELLFQRLNSTIDNWIKAIRAN